ncbi:MAG: Outer membrane protein assembly factor BamB [Anaerolineae bacterium]|nr:Outer membrane protein assembly factor BamB [Anaerolineae bacterium]
MPKLLASLRRWALLTLFVPVLAGCTSQPTPAANTPPPPPLPTTAPEFIDGPTLAPAWTYTAGGPINATPLPAGELVLAAPVGGPLLALDAAGGQLRWQYQPDGKLWERALASDGRLAFVGEAGAKLTALNLADGSVVWQRELGINAQMAPLVAGDTLLVPTTFAGPGIEVKPDGHAKLFALATADGSERWSFETENYILQTPYQHGDVVYVGGSYRDPAIDSDEGGPMRLYALSAGDGAQRWVYESEDGFMKAVYANDDVVAYIAYQDFANGVDARSGQLRWRKDTGNWVPSLAGAEDAVYFSSANTVVHALNTHTGEPFWTYNIAGETFNYGLGKPVRVGDSVLLLSQRGDIISLNAADGALQWRYKTGIVGSRDGLSVAGKRVFIGDSDGNVSAFASP